MSFLLPWTWILGPCLDVMILSPFHVPASLIPSSSLCRLVLTWAMEAVPALPWRRTVLHTGKKIEINSTKINKNRWWFRQHWLYSRQRWMLIIPIQQRLVLLSYRWTLYLTNGMWQCFEKIRTTICSMLSALFCWQIWMFSTTNLNYFNIPTNIQSLLLLPQTTYLLTIDLIWSSRREFM